MVRREEQPPSGELDEEDAKQLTNLRDAVTRDDAALVRTVLENSEFLRATLEVRADQDRYVACADVWGQTLADIAVAYEAREVLRLLPSFGAELSVKRPVALAEWVTRCAGRPQQDTLLEVDALLEMRADVSGVGVDQTLALHYAAERLHAGLAARLLAERSEINALSGAGETPLDLAVRGARWVDPQLGAACRQVVAALCGQGGMLCAEKYATVLAVQQAEPQLTELLLRAGADPNAAPLQDASSTAYLTSNRVEERSPLKVAARQQHLPMASMLLAYGADPAFRAHLYDDTPMVYSIQHCRDLRLVLTLLRWWLEQHAELSQIEFRRQVSDLVLACERHSRPDVLTILRSENYGEIRSAVDEALR